MIGQWLELLSNLCIAVSALYFFPTTCSLPICFLMIPTTHCFTFPDLLHVPVVVQPSSLLSLHSCFFCAIYSDLLYAIDHKYAKKNKFVLSIQFEYRLPFGGMFLCFKCHAILNLPHLCFVHISFHYKFSGYRARDALSVLKCSFMFLYSPFCCSTKDGFISVSFVLFDYFYCLTVIWFQPSFVRNRTIVMFNVNVVLHIRDNLHFCIQIFNVVYIHFALCTFVLFVEFSQRTAFANLWHLRP